MRTETRLASIPPATQVFTYDLDGNMTSDGIWDYGYDAENRLIRMSTVANALAGGFPDRILEFKYDYLGRRMQKRVIDNSVTPGTDVHQRFIYEGWNLLAEYAVSSTSTLNLRRSFVWGLDVTGDLTKAGYPVFGAYSVVADNDSTGRSTG